MDDLISRQNSIDTVDSETVSTNPEHFKSSGKFIKFMDDADIASFGKWQWANGFNTALVAARIQLKKLPSAQRTGRWEPVSMQTNNEVVYRCSVCDKLLWFATNYCPHCGARMESE